MKITNEDYKILEDRIKSFVQNNHARVCEHKKSLQFQSGIKCLDTRFAWDLFWACKFDREFTDKLYTYMNDEHLNTAIKRIVKAIK